MKHLSLPASLLFLFTFVTSPAIAQDDVAQPPAADGAKPVKQVELDLNPRVLIFTGPRRADGTIDYVAALNNKYSEGITQDNNAFRDLMVLFDYVGSGDFDEEWSAIPGQMQALGLTRQDLTRGPHLVDQYDYFENIGYDEEAYAERFDVDPMSAVQAKEVRDWVKLNEPVFEKALAALKKPRYWSPLVDGDETGTLIAVLLPSLGQHRSLARGLCDWCYLLIAEEQYDKALEVFEAIRQLARHQTHHPTLIGNLVGVSIDAIALEMVKQIVSSRSVPDAVLAQLDQLLREREPRVSMAEAVCYGETCMGLDAYIQITSGRIAGSEMLNLDGDFIKAFFGDKPFDINRGVKKVSLYYRQLARAMAAEDYAAKQRLMALLEEQYTSEWDNARSRFFIEVGDAMIPNPAALFGRKNRTDAMTAMFMQIMMPALGSAGRTEIRSLATEQCIYAVIACERYRLKHGKLPEQLSDLVPAYLKQIPIDPFSGEPVLYKQRDDGFVVYGLDENLKDDGGIECFGDIDEGQKGGRWQPGERADWIVQVQWSEQ